MIRRRSLQIVPFFFRSMYASSSLPATMFSHFRHCFLTYIGALSFSSAMHHSAYFTAGHSLSSASIFSVSTAVLHQRLKQRIFSLFGRFRDRTQRAGYCHNVLLVDRQHHFSFAVDSRPERCYLPVKLCDKLCKLFYVFVIRLACSFKFFLQLC